MGQFVEMFRLKRREGTGEWSVLVNDKVLAGIIKGEMTGLIKGTQHQTTGGIELRIKLNANPDTALPDIITEK